MLELMPLIHANEGHEFSGILRILAKRNMGKICFCDARFQEASVQIIMSNVLDNYSELSSLPIGSIIRFDGRKKTTRAGVPSIEISRAEVLYVSKFSAPDKWRKMGERVRYKKRTEDMLTNPEVFSLIKKISTILAVIRQGLYVRDYREFVTGVLQKTFEAGQAKPFITRCNATGKEMFLSLTGELKLKRLLVCGFDNVFEIAQSFRNEGLDHNHSPEFSMLEVYSAGKKCGDMMSLVEQLVMQAVGAIEMSSQVAWIHQSGERRIADYGKPFERISFKRAFELYVGPFENCSLGELIKMHPGQFNEAMTKFTWLMKVVEKFIVPNISQPAFLTELPSGMSPFIAKSNCGEFSDRAFFVSQGIFIADIYTDENDVGKLMPALREQAAVTGNPVNVEFVKALELGIPPTAGIGLGLNRLFMLFVGQLPRNIKETILYPIS